MSGVCCVLPEHCWVSLWRRRSDLFCETFANTSQAKVISALKRLSKMIRQFTTQKLLSPQKKRQTSSTSLLAFQTSVLKMSQAEQNTLIDGEQIRISCCHPQSLEAGVTVYSWSLYCLQFSPKRTKYIKQGLGLGFEVSFFSFPYSRPDSDHSHVFVFFSPLLPNAVT